MKCLGLHLLAPILLFSSACFGQTYQDYYDRGKAEKDPKKRIIYFTQALSVKNTDSAFYYRGTVKHGQEQYAEAIADYDQTIRLNPSFPWAYISRGRAKRHLRKYEEAMADFDVAVSLDNKNDYAYASRGLIKSDLGKYAEAILEYDRAIKLDPNYSQYYYDRGLAYCKSDRHIDALYDFERSIKLDPGDYSGHYASGNEKLHLARYQQAIADFDQVIKLAPKVDDAYNSRGLANEKLGRYNAAIADYDLAIKLNPKQAFAVANKNRTIGLRNVFAANQNNAEPLGFKLGVTPLSAIRSKDDEMQEDGYSYWTGGKKFTSKGTAHNIEGAKRIDYIFNGEDLLDAVVIWMHKDYFHKVNSYLKGKYKLQSSAIPPVGNKYAKYKQGSSLIEIDAPHLSFEMEVIYKTVSFDTAFRNKKATEAMEKNLKQKSKF